MTGMEAETGLRTGMKTEQDPEQKSNGVRTTTGAESGIRTKPGQNPERKQNLDIARNRNRIASQSRKGTKAESGEQSGTETES